MFKSAVLFLFDFAGFHLGDSFPEWFPMDAARESRKRRIHEASGVLRDASISPPPKRKASARNSPVQTHVHTDTNAVKGKVPLESGKDEVERLEPKVVASPVQLNFIEELPGISNVNAISLGSILGDPMIKECWLFNYLFDMDFVMCDYCCRR